MRAKIACLGGSALLLLLLGLAWVTAGCVPGGAAGATPLGSAEANPLAGAFFDDGGDDDIRGRSGALPPCHPGRDELWIFAEGPRDGAPRPKPQGPGGGQMVGRDGAGQVLTLPLRRTDMHASVRGFVSMVDLTQHFENPYAEKIEAIYVFPLPDDAAVRDFVMQIGERQIRGIIRKKEEARAIYQQARAQGYRASLLEQARPNVFEQSVANLEPGKAIDVTMRYVHTLAYGSDGYEFAFPMVVGPRYNPPSWQDGIGVTAAGQLGGTGQPVDVSYLPPDVRPGSDVSLTIDLDAGLALREVTSPSHAIAVERSGSARAKVTLAGGATIANRDFVLRYRLGGEGNRATMFTHADGNGGYLSLLLQPPDALQNLPRQPMELVFLMDCSGSMAGAPLAQSKAAVELAFQQMLPQDRFQIVQFSNRASSFAEGLVPASAANLANARSYLAGLTADGGTEMLTGIEAALSIPADVERTRYVCLLTDGFIGNEVQIFGAVRQRLGGAHVMGLGIGSSVNRYLLEGVARLGRGAVGYLLHDEAPGRTVAQLFERITHPALRDPEIDWGGANVTEVFPARLSDLYAGRPVVVTARFTGPAPTAVQLRGKLGSGSAQFDAAVCADAGEAMESLGVLWARHKIQSMSDSAALEGTHDVRPQIEQVALTYGLMSPFTSFVAVDASERTAGDHGTTIAVPVPMPAGVRYATEMSGR